MMIDRISWHILIVDWFDRNIKWTTKWIERDYKEYWGRNIEIEDTKECFGRTTDRNADKCLRMFIFWTS